MNAKRSIHVPRATRRGARFMRRNGAIHDGAAVNLSTGIRSAIRMKKFFKK
jgi:hypothetical protein